MEKNFYEKYYHKFLDLTEASDEDALTEEKVQYYISENFENYDNVQKGDIVFVKRFIYKNGEIG